MSDKMTIYNIVCKLVGAIDPIGETQTDDRRFENLKTMADLVDKLLFDITRVANNKHARIEYSMKRAGEFADKFLNETKECLDERE